MASRNKIALNAALFEELFRHASAQGDEVANRKEKRFLAFASDNIEIENEVAKRAAVSLFKLSPRVSIMRAEIADGTFFALVNFFGPDERPYITGFEEIEPMSSLLLLLVSEGGIKPTARSIEIREAIEDFHVGLGVDYNGHDVATIGGLFPKVSYFRLLYPDEAILASSIARVAGVFALKSEYFISLPMQSLLKSELVDLFESGPDCVPFEIVLRGCVSSSWAALFLEIYRCVEHIFAAPHLRALATSWPACGSLKDMALVLEEKLSWRPSELSSLERLLKEIDKESVTHLLRCFPSAPTEIDDDSPFNACARRIYKLRNSIVHFRPAHEEEGYEDEKWNDLITCFVVIVKDLYEKVGKEFYFNIRTQKQ